MAANGGLKLDPTVSLGHLIALVPVLGLAFSLAWWIVGYASRIDTNDRRIEEMRGELKALRDDQQVLPDLKARLDADERTIGELKAANQTQQDRIEENRRLVAQAADAIKHLYQPDIPIRRTR